jgi:hypothetical protein
MSRDKGAVRFCQLRVAQLVDYMSAIIEIPGEGVNAWFTPKSTFLHFPIFQQVIQNLFDVIRSRCRNPMFAHRHDTSLRFLYSLDNK